MSKIRQVIVHIADDADRSALADRVSQYHADVIERRLKQSGLSANQKIEVIDKVLNDLQRREIDGVITEPIHRSSEYYIG